MLRDGWLHTGDIGTIDAEGYLTITDRKKDVLVTSGGKKIAPQPIESILQRSPLVSEVMVLGDRRKYAAALIVPDFPVLERRLKDLGRPPGEHGELVTRQDVVDLYQEIVDALNRELSPFERIKRIALLPSAFSVESGELTPTLKIKRKVVEDRWREQIERLYRDWAQGSGLRAQGSRLKAQGSGLRAQGSGLRAQGSVGGDRSRWRFDVDDRVGDLRVLRHQPVLDDVRQPVGLVERHVGREPDVQVEERVIR